MGASCSTSQATEASKASPPEKKEGGGDPLKVPAVKGSLPGDAVIIFVLGGPGSGKGTQCDKIKARYPGVVHLSAGDLLRAEVKSGSVVGKKCQELMTEGKLVPMSVTITLLKNAMITSKGKFFLVDGFPRALDQAEAFEKDVAKCKTVLFFECTQEEMEKRLMHRGQTSGRADDNPETIKKRFDTYVNESLPVKDHFRKQNKCHVISAVPPPEEVFVEVCKVLDPLAPKDAAKSREPEKKKEDKKEKEEEEKEEKEKEDKKEKDDKKEKEEEDKDEKEDKKEETEEAGEAAYEEAAAAKARYQVDEEPEGGADGGDDGAAAGGDDDAGAGGGDDDGERKDD